MRLFDLQVTRRQSFAQEVSRTRRLIRITPAKRGEIFYSTKQAFAINQKTFTVYAVTKDIPAGEYAHTAESLAPLLGKTADEVRQAMEHDPSSSYVPLADHVTSENEQSVRQLHQSGIGTFGELQRVYPDGSATAAISGFLGWEGKGDAGNDHKVGRYGLEQHLEDVLSGVPGKAEADRDGRGRWIPSGERVIVEPQDGSDVVLTIDHPVQLTACSKLEEAIKNVHADGGSVIIMDPMTGGIIALCSAPSYDANAYAKVEDPSRFTNNAMARAYEPGSVFKPITMALGIENGVVTPETTFVDTGSVTFGKSVIKNAHEKSYGKQDMVGVLTNSINTGAVFVARLIGRDRLRAGIERFGFGRTTGVELSGEALGDTRSLQNAGDIYTATASFGQGISVTPMQLAQAFSAIANGGTLLRPTMIKEKHLPDGTVVPQKTEPIRRVISERTAALIKGMLVTVINDGHSKRGGVKGYHIGGKTGTAQVAKQNGLGYSDQTIHTFIGMGPIENPRFVIVTKLDHPRDVEFADSSAAPLAGDIARFLLEYWKIPPSGSN